MAQLKIALCGGGITSLCIAHALCKAPQFEVRIFEASTAFREEGAAVGLKRNAQNALALISLELRKALDDAGGTPMEPSGRVMMGTGPNSGRHVGDLKPSVPQIIVHRGPFLRAIRALVPDGVLEMGKRLNEINLLHESSDRRISLKFDDGTSYEADALIGCDGVNSTTRTIVLGADNPALKPVFTGGYNHRVIIPLEEAISVFGEEYCSFQTQHQWVGEGGFFLTDLVDDATAMQVIAGWSSKGPWPYDSPFVKWPKKQLQQDLEGWGTIGKAMEKVFMNQPQLYAATGRVHPETPSYCRGRICIAGDAAQTFAPFLGAGAGQAIEDALVLSTVLKLCSSSNEIDRAFKVYDAIRRPRRSAVAKASAQAAIFYTGRDPNIGLDMERMAAVVPNYGTDVHDFDVAMMQKQAAEEMVSKAFS